MHNEINSSASPSHKRQAYEMIVNQIDEDEDNMAENEEGSCSQVSFMSVVRVKQGTATGHTDLGEMGLLDGATSSMADNDERLSSGFSYLEQAGVYMP